MSVFPEVVVGPRLVLRRWRVSDMEILRDAIQDSIEHLRPWMSWIEFEPLSDRDRIALIRRWEDDWKAGQEVVFGAFLEDQVVGGCGFHRRASPQTLEIGYWVHVDHLRQGYASEMARILTSAAFKIPKIERVEIHHDKANTRSGAIPDALGYHACHCLRVAAPAGMALRYVPRFGGGFLGECLPAGVPARRCRLIGA